ncbi:MAG: hypothetical protein CMD53_00905 [Gammaproteobacteria bacterium]|nr:hypothetical protein [Gammaproteobacteria bacterium]HJL96366.1 lysophospholipid acyltransferase family protein [SAR86 cluster bacterium]
MSLYKGIYSLFLYTLSLFPLTIISFIGKLLGNCLFFFPNKHKRITLINLSLAFPALKKNELLSLCKKSLIETSINLLESGYVWKRLPGKELPFSIKVEGFKEILGSRKKDEGLLLFTPHQGNIEILINFLGHETKCAAPYTNAKNKYLNSIIREARKKMGLEMVEANLSGVKFLLKHLKDGKVVIIASDQVPEISGGAVSKFFAQKCLSMTLLWKLHSKTNVKLHTVVCKREPKGKGFKIIFGPSVEMPSEQAGGVDTMNKELEKCIMLAPEQYAWEYKKYRRAGSEDIYK